MALISMKFAGKICCRSLCQRINSLIPAAHQTLTLQYLTLSTAPKPIERARTPYVIFLVDKFGELKQANPGVGMTDIGRMVSQLWRLLPDEQKEAYRTRHREEKAAREERLAKMTDTEKTQMKDAARQKRQQRKLRRRRKLNKDLGKPKAGDVNPFIIFMKSKTVERGDAPVTMYVKGLAERWKMMPEEDKEEFVKQAQENSILYRQKLAEWEKKAIAQGHPELVRRLYIKKTSSTPRAHATSRKVKSSSKVAATKPKTRVKSASTQTDVPRSGKVAVPKKTSSHKKGRAVEE